MADKDELPIMFGRTNISFQGEGDGEEERPETWDRVIQKVQASDVSKEHREILTRAELLGVRVVMSRLVLLGSSHCSMALGLGKLH